MVFIEWTEKLSVNVKKIDKQHQELFAIIQKAYDASVFEKKKSKITLNRVFNDLIEYVRVHFSTEEKYFDKCGYEFAGEHIAEHLKYIQKTLELKRRFDKEEDITKEFLDFLKTWWLSHVKIHDMKYVQNFKECGLK